MNISFQNIILLCESTTFKYLLIYTYIKSIKKKISKANSFIYDDGLFFGEFYHLYPQLRTNNASFRMLRRITPNTFDYILNFITPELFFCD